MIRAVTIALDVQTIDASLPAKLMAGAPLIPGATRPIPGGVMVFQSALLNQLPGEASLFRFSIQFGARQAAALVGNWLYAQLYGTAAAVIIGGRPVAIGHHDIIFALKNAA